MRVWIRRGGIVAVFLLFEFGLVGCSSLIVRPNDSFGKATAKVLTRVVLLVPTLTISEQMIEQTKAREYYARSSQEIELYRGKWIAYGIGNLMFNSGGRYSKLGTPPYSIPARLVLEDTDEGFQKTLRFYPIVSNNALTGFQPRMVTFREFAEVYKLLRERSWDPSAFAEATAIGRDEAGTYLEVRLI